MRQDDWLLAQLPVAMTEDDFLARFVHIFQDVGDTLLHQVDNLRHLADVTVTPDSMVRLMGAWLGLDWIDPSLPDHLQRLIVSEYAKGLVWRGTSVGLQRLLTAVTRKPVTVNDSGGVYAEGEAPAHPPHVVVEVSSAPWITANDLLRIVRSELPATVTFELFVDGRAMIGTAA